MPTDEEIQEQLERSRDELLRMLGLVTTNYNGLEFTVRMFIAQLMVKGIDGANATMQLNIAMLITAEMSFYKMLTLLESLFKFVEQDPELVTEASDLIARSAGAANGRDRMVHSGWGGSPSFQNPLLMKVTAKKEKNQPQNLKLVIREVPFSEIEGISNALWEADKALNLFMRAHGYGY